METWKIIGLVLLAIVVIAVVIRVVIYFDKKNEGFTYSRSSRQSFAPPLSRRERFVNAKSGSLDNFIEKYISAENGNWK